MTTVTITLGELTASPKTSDAVVALLKMRAPRHVICCGDLFHEDVPDDWIDRVFAVMALTPQHTYQVLTKRSASMRQWSSMITARHAVNTQILNLTAECPDREYVARKLMGPWPLPNVWLGVSAERQVEADARIPDLLATPAAVKFVSAEPLLGPIDFSRIACGQDRLNALRALIDMRNDGGGYTGAFERHPSTTLDWVICGGESGPDARPMHPDWARGIRDQCTAAGVAYFFKQWGEWAYARGVTMDKSELVNANRELILSYSGGVTSGLLSYARDAVVMARLGKSRAGRLLDGREWNEMPGAAPAPTGAPENARPSREVQT